MSTLLTSIIGFSLIFLTMLSTYRLMRDRKWMTFIFQFVALILCFLFLHQFFGFPTISQATPKGKGNQEIYLVIVLYFFMLLGMAAHYAYTHFEQPQRKRRKFDFGLFFAPVFASPIIFIPLLAALQNADLDLTHPTAPKIMVFFVAFENGFFWKDYFDHRRKEREKK